MAGGFALLTPALLKLPRSAAYCAGVLVIALVQMAFDMPPDQVLLEAVVLLIALKVISVKEALDGFRSEGVVAVAVMCAVAKSVQTTGGIQLISRYLLGSPKGHEMALLRMILATMAISAFMNNTPVCAMMMPILTSWAGTVGVAPSALLMPLSFATMLGGTLTMIGSSTNLVAANAAHLHDPSFSMKVFDITQIGVINALAGTAYMVLFGRKLLPQGDVTAPAKPASTSSAAVAPRGVARLWLALGLITITMSVAAQSPKALLPMALGCLCLLIRSGCLTLKEAWGAVNGPVLLSIALSFALGEGIKRSTLAEIIAEKIVTLVMPYGELALLFAVYFVAILIGAVISNNAVVALMFPVTPPPPRFDPRGRILIPVPVKCSSDDPSLLPVLSVPRPDRRSHVREGQRPMEARAVCSDTCGIGVLLDPGVVPDQPHGCGRGQILLCRFPQVWASIAGGLHGCDGARLQTAGKVNARLLAASFQPRGRI